MKIIEHRALGIFPAQDHTPGAELASRSFLGLCRIVRTNLDITEPYEETGATFGDWTGFILGEVHPNERSYLHTWRSSGFPVIRQGDSGETAERGREPGFVPQLLAGVPDPRFKAFAVDLEHPIVPEQQFPGRQTGHLTAGTEDTRQEIVFHPDFLGLVAPYRDGPEEAGTLVFDLNSEGELDDTRFARFQTSQRVVAMPPAAPLRPGVPGRPVGLLAWQLHFARAGIYCGGLVSDAGTGPAALTRWEPDEEGPPSSGTQVGRVTFFGPASQAPPSGGTQVGGITFFGVPVDGETRERERTGTEIDPVGPDRVKTPGAVVLACASSNVAGPFEVSDPTDRHHLGFTEDGEAVKALHIHTRAIHRDEVWDSPLEHRTEPYQETQRGQVLVPVYLRQDMRERHLLPIGVFPGLGRWQSESMGYFVPPDQPKKPPPPTDEIPGGVLIPAGGGGKKPTGKPVGFCDPPERRGNSGYGQIDKPDSTFKVGPGGVRTPTGTSTGKVSPQGTGKPDSTFRLTPGGREDVPAPTGDPSTSRVVIFRGKKMSREERDAILQKEREARQQKQTAAASQRERDRQDRDDEIGPQPFIIDDVEQYEQICQLNYPTMEDLDTKQKLGVNVSLAPQAVSSLAIRPQSAQIGKLDARRAWPLDATVTDYLDRTTPTTAHVVGFGKEDASGWFYGTKPCDGLWPGGDADGGAIIAPPDLEQRRILDRTVSERSTYYALHPQVVFGFGRPASDGSSLIEGWRIQQEDFEAESGPQPGDLSFHPVDAAGNPQSSTQMRVDAPFHVQRGDGIGIGFFSVNPYTDYAIFDLALVEFSVDAIIHGRLTVDGGIDPVYLEFDNGSAQAVSAAGKCRLRYHAGLDQLQISKNGAAYTELAGGGGSGGASAATELTVRGPFRNTQEYLDHLLYRVVRLEAIVNSL